MTQRFTGLDMLRGIAALVVAFNHAPHMAGQISIFSRSYLAVDFFFLLSGFVIAATFEQRMAAQGTWSFLTMRWVRLWPMIAVGAVLAALVHLSDGADGMSTAICLALALAFLPAFNGYFYMNIPMWSVHFELVANVVHSLALRRVSVAGLLVIAASCLALLWAAHGWHDLDVGQAEYYLLGIPRVIMSYSLGIVLWRVNGAKARGPAWLAFIILPLAIFAASKVIWADYIVALLINPLILLWGLGFNEESRVAPIGRFLGAWSFPLYALHWPVLDVALRNGLDWPIALAWAIGVSLVIGLLLDRRMRAAFLWPKRRELAIAA